MAIAAGGDRGRAAELAAEELRLAEALGTNRAIGIAMRGLALSEGDDGLRIAGLAAAIERLRDSTARLELARTLIELGAALRHAKRPREARTPLREAVGLAAACGSAALEQRARDELGAAGEAGEATDDGLAALTPSELRVARMAAAGMSNREIATDLEVGERTVEVHLTRTYRKLGVRNRRTLIAEYGERFRGS